MEICSYWLDKVWTSIWRDVRTMDIEEAYTKKYSIHPGADTMLCGFRLTNQWLSMKKDIVVKLPSVTVLWAVTGESELNGSNLVPETTNKIVVIQERLEAAKLSEELT
ncbi:hypothetical protein Tco_0172382 [Tanacetum coccineum]